MPAVNNVQNTGANPYGGYQGRMTPLEAEGARLGGMANRPTMPTADQTQALGLYQSAALGQAPSAAQSMLTKATDQNVANQLSMAAASRGGNLGAAERGASIAGVSAGAQGAQDLSALRANEMAQALQGYGAMSSDVAGQGLANDLAMEQMLQQHTLTQQQLGDAYKLGDRALDAQAKRDMWSNILGLGQLASSTIGSAMGGAAMSDERVKENIQPGGLAATQAVGELQPATFRYKPGFGAPGERVGIMAQDLEKTPAGQSIVMNTPLGKAVDTNGLAALGVAATSENTHELAAQKQEIEQLKAMLGGGGGYGGPRRSMPLPLDAMNSMYPPGMAPQQHAQLGGQRPGGSTLSQQMVRNA